MTLSLRDRLGLIEKTLRSAQADLQEQIKALDTIRTTSAKSNAILRAVKASLSVTDLELDLSALALRRTKLPAQRKPRRRGAR